MLENRELFTFACASTEHLFVVSNEDEYEEVYFNLYLNNVKTFWQRVKTGLRYIFLSEKDFVYGEVILNYNDTLRLKEKLEKHLNECSGDNACKK